jgi:hypothetical protein
MGTSKSNGGPKDKIPLLPDWAFPPLEEEEPPLEEEEQEQENPPDPEDEVEKEDEGDDNDADDDDGSDEPADDDDADVGTEQAPTVETSTWRSARTFLSKAVKKSGDRRAEFRRAAQSYVRAHGGARRASQNSPSGRAATGRLAGFLSDVARRGIDAALEALNLSSVVGRDAQTVFAAISNALSPEGASPEQAVAREAINDVLSDIYERFVGDDGDISKLNALTGEDVAKAITDSVSTYIYKRWLQELGKQIEKKAVSSSEAVSLEREAKLFIKDSVKLDFKTTDPLSVNWKTDGHSIVETIYTQAYSLFGAGR